MEQRISLITLGVADLDRARRFYKDGLGWTPRHDGDGVIFFQMGGMVLALWPQAELTADSRLPGPGVPGAVALAHNARSREAVNAVMAHAERAGATILKPAADTVWGGYAGCFADPDGHPWEVAWNPHWKMAEDGSILPP